MSNTKPTKVDINLFLKFIEETEFNIVIQRIGLMLNEVLNKYKETIKTKKDYSDGISIDTYFKDSIIRNYCQFNESLLPSSNNTFIGIDISVGPLEVNFNNEVNNKFTDENHSYQVINWIEEIVRKYSDFNSQSIFLTILEETNIAVLKQDSTYRYNRSRAIKIIDEETIEMPSISISVDSDGGTKIFTQLVGFILDRGIMIPIKYKQINFDFSQPLVK